MTRNVVVCDGTGKVRAQWDNVTNNGTFTIDQTRPTLTTDNTMTCYARTGNTPGLFIDYRLAGVTYPIELSSERPIGTDITTASVTRRAGPRRARRRPPCPPRIATASRW
jgi:hypothetical protein